MFRENIFSPEERDVLWRVQEAHGLDGGVQAPDTTLISNFGPFRVVAVPIVDHLTVLLVEIFSDGRGRFASVTTEAVALAAGGNRRLVAIYALLQMALPFLAFALAALAPAVAFRARRDLQPSI